MPVPAPILIIGGAGQLASSLDALARARGVAALRIGRPDFDFDKPRTIADAFRSAQPSLVVNAAAYTAVDAAESDQPAAMRANHEGPALLAALCRDAGVTLIHVSTDYVFDGRKGAPYVETDPTSPQCVYGATKLAGEQAVAAACARSLSIRTSWVVSAHGKNFIKTMLRVAAAGSPLKVVDDQLGRPTSAADLARFILTQAPRLAAAEAGDPVFGIVHFANADEVSWRGFAKAIFAEALGDQAPEVGVTTTAEYVTPATRPLRATMDTAKVRRVFGVTPRSWRAALVEIVAELKAQA